VPQPCARLTQAEKPDEPLTRGRYVNIASAAYGDNHPRQHQAGLTALRDRQAPLLHCVTIRDAPLHPACGRPI